MSDTQVENNEMTNAHFPQDDVRIEDDLQQLENAEPAKGNEAGMLAVLQETQLSGGSDNTASPAGGNPTHQATLDSHQQVADSQVAQQEHQSEAPTLTDSDE